MTALRYQRVHIAKAHGPMWWLFIGIWVYLAWWMVVAGAWVVWALCVALPRSVNRLILDRRARKAESLQ